MDENQVFSDTPRIGPLMWLLLAAFLIPPAAVTLVGNISGALPHQTLWVILLGSPVFLILITLPRRYELSAETLCIYGVFYKKRIALAEVSGLKRLSKLKATLHPGSMYCSDPATALAIERQGRRSLVISPRDPAAFEARLLILSASGKKPAPEEADS